MTKKRDRKTTPEKSQQSKPNGVELPYLLVFQVQMVTTAKGPDAGKKAVFKAFKDERLRKAFAKHGISRVRLDLIAVGEPKSGPTIVTPPSGLVGADGKPLSH